MKTTHTPITAGFVRRSLLVAVSLGFSTMAATAAPVVTVPLAGEEFGTSVNARAESTGLVSPAKAYFYRITGSCHGTGDFQDAVPENTKFAELLNDIQEGAAAALSGTKRNADGDLPFVVLDKTVSGTKDFVTFSLTLRIAIESDGRVVFEARDLSATSPFGNLSGSIVFEPGTKMVVGVAPVIKMVTETQSVLENVPSGFAAVKVTRTGNLNVESSVNYKTVEGTATAGPDATDDFKSVSGKLTFLPGDDGPKTIKVPIKNNALKDGNRNFKVNLINPVTAVLGDVTTTVVTIKSDE